MQIYVLNDLSHTPLDSFMIWYGLSLVNKSSIAVPPPSYKFLFQHFRFRFYFIAAIRSKYFFHLSHSFYPIRSFHWHNNNVIIEIKCKRNLWISAKMSQIFDYCRGSKVIRNSIRRGEMNFLYSTTFNVQA